MYKYDPKSTKAEEFINDEEILATLKYADENKNNTALIDSILEKGKVYHIERLLFFWLARILIKSSKCTILHIR